MEIEGVALLITGLIMVFRCEKGQGVYFRFAVGVLGIIIGVVFMIATAIDRFICRL